MKRRSLVRPIFSSNMTTQKVESSFVCSSVSIVIIIIIFIVQRRLRKKCTEIVREIHERPLPYVKERRRGEGGKRKNRRIIHYISGRNG